MRRNTETCRLACSERRSTGHPLTTRSSPGSPSFDRQTALRASLEAAGLVSCCAQPASNLFCPLSNWSCATPMLHLSRPLRAGLGPPSAWRVHVASHKDEQAARPSCEMERCERSEVNLQYHPGNRAQHVQHARVARLLGAWGLRPKGGEDGESEGGKRSSVFTDCRCGVISVAS